VLGRSHQGRAEPAAAAGLPRGPHVGSLPGQM
jgi:hypothetical protein